MNKLIINHQELTNLVSKIAREIAIGNWKPDYIVGLTRGGLIPAVMLSHYLNVPLHTLNVSMRDGDTKESNLWMAEEALGYPVYEDNNYKNILIVDDINDQGTTLNWIMNDWKASCLPEDPAWDEVWNGNVKFAVLVDNLSSKCEVEMDFTGMEINKAENDVWVDFPWEDWWQK